MVLWKLFHSFTSRSPTMLLKSARVDHWTENQMRHLYMNYDRCYSELVKTKIIFVYELMVSFDDNRLLGRKREDIRENWSPHIII